MKMGRLAEVRRQCDEFLAVASQFYKVPRCGIRVLASRPLRVRENWTTELFGDYTPDTMIIRVCANRGAQGNHVVWHVP